MLKRPFQMEDSVLLQISFNFFIFYIDFFSFFFFFFFAVLPNPLLRPLFKPLVTSEFAIFVKDKLKYWHFSFTKHFAADLLSQKLFIQSNFFTNLVRFRLISPNYVVRGNSESHRNYKFGRSLIKTVVSVIQGRGEHIQYTINIHRHTNIRHRIVSLKTSSFLRDRGCSTRREGLFALLPCDL